MVKRIILEEENGLKRTERIGLAVGNNGIRTNSEAVKTVGW